MLALPGDILAQSAPANFGRLSNAWGSTNGGITGACSGSGYVQIDPPTGWEKMLFTQVATGNCHAVALRRNGSVVAWGLNGDNRVTGTTQLPAPSPSTTGFVAVAAGWNHSVALKNDGHIVLWGANFYGQTTRPELIDPSKVPGNVWVRFSAIDAGEHITVGIVNMPEYPTIDGLAMIWGAVPSATGTSTPPPGYPPYAEFGYITPAGVVLSNPDVTVGRIVEISGVGHHVLLRRNASGPTVFGWGMNAADFDGDGQPDRQSEVPTSPSWVPDAPRIATGHRHSLVLSINGELWGFGMNPCGQIGAHPGDPQGLGPCGYEIGSPIAMKFPPGTPQERNPAHLGLRSTMTFRKVAGGYEHSVGIIRAPGTVDDGKLVAWGRNKEEQCNTPAGIFIDVSSTHWHGYAIHCYADADKNGDLNWTLDFAEFQAKLALSEPWTDCNGDGEFDEEDQECFSNYFNLGCFP